jgi:hypothetical protein
MRLRIEGSRAEITHSVLALRGLYVVTHVSRPRPARRQIYRVYVDAYQPTAYTVPTRRGRRHD